jgi:hypothetical protein
MEAGYPFQTIKVVPIIPVQKSNNKIEIAVVIIVFLTRFVYLSKKDN